MWAFHSLPLSQQGASQGHGTGASAGVGAGLASEVLVQGAQEVAARQGAENPAWGLLAGVTHRHQASLQGENTGYK